ncbi:MAG: DUF3592 domain-containing protein [bacterium]|nr:DUF3592 domain-containing protein [bacterium]
MVRVIVTQARLGIGGALLFLLCGLVALSFSVFYLVPRAAHFDRVAVKAEGMVVDVGMREENSSKGTSILYFPIVAFTPQSGEKVTFQSNHGSSNLSYHKGDTVEVSYDPAEPTNAQVGGSVNTWIPPVGVGVLGLLFSLIGGFTFRGALRNRRLRKRLEHEGTPVTAVISSISRGEAYSMFARSRYRITARWTNPQNGIESVFESEPVSGYPSEFAAGQSVPVLINPENPEEYFFRVERGGAS